MKRIRIKCPAKINLTLEVVNKRSDGFHNIKSIMQMISLYDYLTISVNDSENLKINLSGTSDDIPYDERNLVYKAAKLFFDKTNLLANIHIHIEKNIPISAGLAGGSTNASGALLGLNKIFDEPLEKKELHELCAFLGSDLNVCLEGGCLLATGRGEKIQKLPFTNSSVSLIKPKTLGISAKEAYTKYSKKDNKPKYNYTEKMLDALENKNTINEFLYNDLEYAVFDDYVELQQIKSKYPQSIMSGSGSTYFVLDNLSENKLGEDYLFINNLEFIEGGVEILE